MDFLAFMPCPLILKGYLALRRGSTHLTGRGDLAQLFYYPPPLPLLIYYLTVFGYNPKGKIGG